MSIVVLILAFLFIAILNIAMVLFLIFAFDSLARGHDLPTSRRAIRALIKIAKQYKPDAEIFYDLGCAHGDLSLAVKKTLPDLMVYGIDNSAARIFFAQLKSKILRIGVNFSKQDILNTDVSSADIVYAYLWYDMMPLLERKLQKELKRGAVVITNTSNFPLWKPVQKIITYPKVSRMPDFETLFVYMKE